MLIAPRSILPREADRLWTTSQPRPTRLARISAEGSLKTPGWPVGVSPGSGGAGRRGSWASSSTAAEGASLWPSIENQLRAQLNRVPGITDDPRAGVAVATTSHWALTPARRTRPIEHGAGVLDPGR